MRNDGSWSNWADDGAAGVAQPGEALVLHGFPTLQPDGAACHVLGAHAKEDASRHPSLPVGREM